ncbi:MAG: hypothetical protein KI792_13585 [Alphaproteobacteria bacterium]|nr:hypothetical protein [Alphaproteobacteria bacterium SS10]
MEPLTGQTAGFLQTHQYLVMILPLLVAAGYLYWMFWQSPWVRLARKYPARRLPKLLEHQNCTVAAININRVQYTAKRVEGHDGIQNYVIPHESGLYLTTKAVVFDKQPIRLPWHTVRRVTPAPEAEGLTALTKFHEIELEVEGAPYLIKLQKHGTDGAMVNRIVAYAR